ncbi:dUTPase [Bacillus pseudomycoides]|uniref:dUTPase n=1 Tax=Bacillus pseudomycoides TaxID=64104 RepID=A0AA91ZSE7_9BACI|nr:MULTISPECIES: dUTP diphosphatase [Bacillus]PEB56225.1 dUTPase [Bacillus sp. AFS098217]PED81655.1 dUTPase [Bacillus pseudomycoides]
MDKQQIIIEELICKFKIYKMKDGRQLYELSTQELQRLLEERRKEMMKLHRITDKELETKFNLRELFAMQKELDKRIDYRDEDRIELKFYSLHVEVNEAWNETMSFKFWSKRFKEPDTDKLLEELIDGLHFLLSIVLDINTSTRSNHNFIGCFNYAKIHSRHIYSVNRLFEMWSTTVLKAKKKWVAYRIFPVAELRIMFGVFFRICYLYDFTYKDIVRAYKEKNKENFIRQASGY